MLTPGCYEMHGRGAGGLDAGPLVRPDSTVVRPDAPGRVDTGVCELIPVPATLSCPTSVAVGEHLVAHTRIDAPGCCSSEGATLTVEDGTFPTYALSSGWSACSCCLDCECETPPADVSVDLGVMGTAGTVTIRLGDQSCTVEVSEGAACFVVSEDEVLAPDVRFVGEGIPVLVRSRSVMGCSCTPRARVLDAAGRGPAFVLEQCDCSIDPCVDPGAEATFVAAPSEVASPRSFDHLAHVIVETRRRESCFDLTSGAGTSIDTVTEIAPSDEHVSDGNVWIRIDGHERRCCGVPAIAVTTADEPNTYGIAECDPDPCDCVGGPVPFTTYHHLGVLPPGRHRIRVLDRDVVIDR